MGLAEPREPEPDPKKDDRDWLVGPEDGLAAELGHADAERPQPKLVRPIDSETDTHAAPPTGPAPTLFRPGSSDAVEPGTTSSVSREMFAPKRPAAPATPSPNALGWEPGANSVPTLRQEPSTRAPIHEPERDDFPMDDAEERAKAAAVVAEQEAVAAETAARPHAVIAPSEFEMPAPALPWWMQVPDLVRRDRRVQLGLGAALVALLAWTYWPRDVKTVSLGHILHQPAQFADQRVLVRGRVVEVFAVGQGWAFTFRQGRDTVVVFTRSRMPRLNQDLTLSGTVSTGYLDGQPRTAIFESTTDTDK